MPWHRTRWAGPLLRLAGAVLLAIAYAGGRHLFAAPGHAPGALDCLLALVAFVALSAGSALLTLGGHLLDEVELSPRWRRRF